MFLLPLAVFDARLFVLEFFTDDEDEVELPEWLFSVFIAADVVKFAAGRAIWSGSINDPGSHFDSIFRGWVGADVVTEAEVVQFIKSAVCDWTKMLLFAYGEGERVSCRESSKLDVRMRRQFSRRCL